LAEESQEELDKKVEEGFRIAAKLTKNTLPAVSSAVVAPQQDKVATHLPQKPAPMPKKPKMRSNASKAVVRFPRQPLSTQRKSGGYRPGFLARKYWNTFDGVTA